MEKNIDTAKKDAEVMQNYKDSKAWGMSCQIDLKNCNPKLIRDADYIKKFVIELCKLIDMKRFGETQVVNFGEDEKVCGYSMTQLIETSLISAHFAEYTNAIYLDIFSCKEYPPYKTAEFCKKFFESDKYNLNISLRI
jgi:S-adenosylmethionine/arginine decarboxylase-like enzyme